MKNYLQLLYEIVQDGEMMPNRTGTDAISVFGKNLTFDLSKGFPLVTTKKIFFRGVIEELLWILRGETNIQSLVDKGVHIWDAWADADGNLGPIYGHQWRNFRGEDQILNLVDGLFKNPRSRRHIVSAWNPCDLPHEGFSPQRNVQLGKMALAPCHVMFQCYASRDADGAMVLSMQVVMRSVDSFLGMPFNIASYAAMLHILSYLCGARPGKLHMIYGDTHIYKNHLTQVHDQLARTPRDLPKLQFYPSSVFRGDVSDFIEKLRFEDFHLTEYDPYPALTGEISI